MVCELANDAAQGAGFGREHRLHRYLGYCGLWSLVHLVGEDMTRIVVDLSGVRQTTWRQYMVRFLVGGAITALVGIIGMKFGPGVGGLFLAFPAIFPASATLVEQHELEKKRRAGLIGVRRSREVAGVDAAGAAMGAVGLLAFAVTVYKTLPTHPAWEALNAALVVWVVVSVLVWRIHKAI
jgi:hypothetical protein